MKLILLMCGLLLGAVIASEMIVRYMPSRDKPIEEHFINRDKPFKINKETCHELTWMTTDPCWEYN